MTQPQSVMEYLEETGHIRSKDQIPTDGSHSYVSVPFSPRFISGLLMHSLLSTWPQHNFYTDGEEIYHQNGVRPANLTPEHKEAMVREDLVLHVLSASPQDPKNIYVSVEDRLRVVDFSDAFTANGEINADYQRFFKATVGEGSHIALWQALGRQALNGKIAENRKRIRKLLVAMKNDQEPYPTYAGQLETRLEQQPAYESKEAEY